MGGGLALQIKNKWPRVYEYYARYCQLSPELGDVCYADANKNIMVANLFGKCRIGGNKNNTVYGVYPKMLEDVVSASLAAELPIYIPYGIGCGLAGGDWNIMLPILEKHLLESATIVKYNGV